VAVVAPRFGSDFVGGAERSLRLIARTMQQQGHHAEVFTTCTRQESDWHNELPAGTERAEGLLVHRFPVDEHDRGSFQSALDVIRRQHGQVDTATEQAYLRNSLQSSTLIEALGQRERDFDAIIVGPYLFGLTHEVAAKFRRKVLFVPCFHDEPFARLPTLQATYREVGGLLYHSPEEKWLAEARLGINHPNATVIGTLLDGEAVTPSDIQHSHATPPRRLVYCGRYSVEKGVQLLLEYAERYTSQHPERFRFVFIGHGPLALPKRAWLENLGFVTEHRKRQELSNAAALVQLSTNESLSLVALEAWAQGLPVIGHEKCVVVREQIRRANGGVTIADYAGFAAALDQLWANPERWRQLGENGKRFVDEQYRSADQFASRLRTTIRNLNRPLPDLLREKGLLRAAHFSEPVWERRLAKLLEELMDTPPRSASPELQVLPQAERKHVTAQQHSILIPVRIRNTGGLPVAAEGPGVATVGYELRDEHGKLLHRERSAARLPALLRPDSEQLLVVPINLPQGVGPWSVTFSIFRRTSMSDVRQESKSIEICLHDSTESRIDTPASGFLHAAQQAVHRAQALQELPDDYRDVTQGVLAGWKRRVKEKLLHQFRKSYVDVLSRQQSAFNEQMLIALCQMIDAITTSDQAADAATLGKSFQQQIRRADRRARRRLARIERRLEILEEALVERKESVP
jgi:glycosyltransferase involved in cell wall biosynthesis